MTVFLENTSQISRKCFRIIQFYNVYFKSCYSDFSSKTLQQRVLKLQFRKTSDVIIVITRLLFLHRFFLKV